MMGPASLLHRILLDPPTCVNCLGGAKLHCLRIASVVPGYSVLSNELLVLIICIHVSVAT